MTPTIAPDDVLVELRERLLEEAEAFGGSPDEDDEGNVLAALFTQAADAIIGLQDRIERQAKIIAATADAIDVADNIIAINLGTDTPKEWDRAFRRVAKARAALANEGGEVASPR